MLKLIACIFSVLFLLSCSDKDFPKSDHLLPLSKSNSSSLNGHYRNYSNDTSLTEKITLWNVITPRKKMYAYDTSTTYKSANVELFLKNNKTLIARLYNEDKLINEKKFKGRIKDGYFSSRRRINYFGLPFLYLTYFDYKFQIGKDSSNTLLIDAGNGRFGWILIMTGGNTETYNFKFQPK
jgi:hypothetical protein